MTKRGERRVVPSDWVVEGNAVHNVPGNNFDKHGSANPVVRYLMARFHRQVLAAVRSFPHESILDVGCGEGRTTEIVAEATGARVVGVELEPSALAYTKGRVVQAAFVVGSAYSLPLTDASVDVVLATEMLEHLDQPNVALREMDRVARHGIVVSVPEEPLLRIGNLARGAYVRSFGNTPGHVQHWSRRGFLKFLSSEFDDVRVETVRPWSLAIIRR